MCSSLFKIALLTNFVAFCYCVPHTNQIIDFKLAARNLPAGKNPYVEIQSPIYCRTETINDERNPNWTRTCSVEHIEGRRLNFEIWHDRSFWPDESIGHAFVETGDMLNAEKPVTAGIYSDNVMVGVLEVTAISTRKIPAVRHVKNIRSTQ